MLPISAMSLPTSLDAKSLSSLLSSKAASNPISQEDIQALTSNISKTAGASPTTDTTAATTPTAVPGISSVQNGGGSFSNILNQFVSEVNTKQVAAEQNVNGMLSGGNVSLHQAMISMEEANVSFQLMIEVRNKLLDSYQELMRMQV